MIPLRQYIDEHIERLNRLDQEMPLMQVRIDAADPERAFHLQRAVNDLKRARDAADQKLLELFSLRSAEWASEPVVANTEAVWGELQAALHVTVTLFNGFHDLLEHI